MADGRKQILAKPIQLANQVSKWAGDAQTNKPECLELKARADKLAELLRQAARADLYHRPAHRIMDDTAHVLAKALALAAKWRNTGLVYRAFTIPPAAHFAKTCAQMDNSIADVSWLLRVSTPADGLLHGLCPFAQSKPFLTLIWDSIAALHAGDPGTRSEAAATLVSLARDNHHFAKLIIEEDGVAPLLRLLKEGETEAQENAARALGLLGRDPDSVDCLVAAGVCSAFAKVLKDGPMKVQAIVAWAVAELAFNRPKCQDVFAQNNVVRLLVGHLAVETVQGHNKYSVPWKSQQQHSLSGSGHRGREMEDPGTKAHMKAMAAKALWQLAKGNADICRSITESGALPRFAALLEKGAGDVRHNSAMALVEIVRVAEHNDDLRRSAFKPNSPAAKAVIDQFLQIVERGEHSDLLIPSITALGCLSTTFRVTETRIIGPLVRLLVEENEAVVAREALIALTKFASTSNHLFVNNSKAIVDAGVATRLAQLVYLGEQLQVEALILLCYIVKHVPESKVLAEAGVLNSLLWASTQRQMVQDGRVDGLLPEAKARLELYQSQNH